MILGSTQVCGFNKTTPTYFCLGAEPSQTKAVQVPNRMCNVGEKVTFFIQTRNKNGLNNNSGGDEFEIACMGPSELTDLTITDTNNGKYTISFTPTATGIYEFDIAIMTVIGKEPIGNTPVKITTTRK